MPPEDWSDRIPKKLGYSSWQELTRVAEEKRARDRARWAAQAHLRFWGTQGPARTTTGTCARRNDDSADFSPDDEKDLGLRKLYGDQDDDDEASDSESAEASDSSMDDADEGPEDGDEDDEEGDSDEDDGDDNDDDDHDDGEFSDKGDDGSYKKTQLRN